MVFYLLYFTSFKVIAEEVEVNGVTEVAIIAVGKYDRFSKSGFSKPPLKIIYESDEGEAIAIPLAYNRFRNFVTLPARESIGFKRQLKPQSAEVYHFFHVEEPLQKAKSIVLISPIGNEGKEWREAKVTFVIDTNRERCLLVNLCKSKLKFGGEELKSYSQQELDFIQEIPILEVKKESGGRSMKLQLRRQSSFFQMIVFYDAEPLSNRGRELGYFYVNVPLIKP